MKNIFFILLSVSTFLVACSGNSEMASEYAQQGYQDARKMGLTHKFECIRLMIGSNANQLEGCFKYLEEYQNKARAFSQGSESDEFEAAPAAPALSEDEESGDCLVTENDATFVGECNNFIQAE